MNNDKSLTLSKFDKEHKRVNSILEFLKELHSLTKNGFAPMSVSDWLQTNSLSYTVIQAIVDLKIAASEGKGAGRKYKWLVATPDLNLAERIDEESRRLANAYSRTKAAEKRITSTGTIQMGHKTFMKIIKPIGPGNAIEKKKQPQTITEINMEQTLKLVRYLLDMSNCMDFSGLCDSKGISHDLEKAMLATVVQKTKEGYRWIVEEITYDVIRKVIDVKKDITMGRKFHPQLIKYEEAKPEVAIKNNDYELNDADDMNTRLLKALRNIFIDSQTQSTKSMGHYQVLHRVSTVLGTALCNLKLIQKIDTGKYTWLGAEPTIALAHQVRGEINRYSAASARKISAIKKSGNLNVATATITNTEKVVEMKEEIKTPIITEIAKEVIADKKGSMMTLAEKFAKAGNYSMAEQLLDQMIEK